MNLSTFRKYWSGKRTKLFIITGEEPCQFLLGGYVSNSREDGDGLLLDIGPYATYSFDRDEVVNSDGVFEGVKISADSRFTRKITTHMRNARNIRETRDLKNFYSYFDALREL